MIGRFSVGLQCFLSGNGSDLVESFFDRVFWVSSLKKEVGHFSECLQETPVRRDDFAHAGSRGVVKETHNRSLFGGRFAVGLQCLTELLSSLVVTHYLA